MTGAFGLPGIMSVDLMSMFSPLAAAPEIGFEFYPQAVKAKTASMDTMAMALRWVFLIS